MSKKASKMIAVLLVLVFLLLPMEVLAVVETPAIEMEDVSPDDWFYRYIVDGLRFGLITGVSGDTFRFVPDRNVTRGEFITMLGRLHEYRYRTIGMPGDGPFYQRYLEWAVEMGIVHGNQHGDLMPRALVNREQMAVIVYRYIDVFGLWEYFRHEYTMIGHTQHDFYDISTWARGPVLRLHSNLLISNSHGRFFEPHDTVSRAEALQILIRVSSAVYDLVHPMPRL